MFLQKIHELTKDGESPGSFWKWSAYAMIAAVVRDNVYINYGIGKLYPNIYVLLLAESGHHRKGAGVTLAEGLISKVKTTKLINGRSSIQGITDELCKVIPNSNGEMLKGGSAIFLAGELAAALVQDRSAIDIMTDIYDYKEEYQVTLRGRENSVAKDVVFSMLAASNINMLDEMFSQAATFGGLLARTFVVVPNEQRPPNSLLEDSPGREKLYLECLDELKIISKLKGKLAFTADAKRSYIAWYNEFRTAAFLKRDKIGILGRLHTGVVKLSMLLALNAGSLEIRKEFIDQAIEECTDLVPNYKQFVGKSGVAVDAKVAALLIETLVKSPVHSVTRRDFIGANWEDVSIETLESSVIRLEQAGFIRQDLRGSMITYVLTELGKETMEVKG